MDPITYTIQLPGRDRPFERLLALKSRTSGLNGAQQFDLTGRGFGVPASSVWMTGERVSLGRLDESSVTLLAHMAWLEQCPMYIAGLPGTDRPLERLRALQARISGDSAQPLFDITGRGHLVSADAVFIDREGYVMTAPPTRAGWWSLRSHCKWLMEKHTSRPDVAAARDACARAEIAAMASAAPRQSGVRTREAIPRM